MNRKGFTLIELLIVVVIIGILAAIAIPKFANTKQKAVVASMKSDLRNLVTAEEAYFSDYNTYAPAVGAAQAAGVVAFTPSTGNVLTLAAVTAGGWNATMTNPAVNSPAQTCGIFVGTAARPGGMPATQQEGSPVCW